MESEGVHEEGVESEGRNLPLVLKIVTHTA